MKQLRSIFHGLIVGSALLTGCEPFGGTGGTSQTIGDLAGSVDIGATVDDVMADNEVDHETSDPVTWNNEDAGIIKLMGTWVEESLDGVSFADQELLISKAGVYTLSGSLDNGLIRISSEEEAPVILILDGVEVTCSWSAPLQVDEAECTVISLAAESENRFTDGPSYIFERADEDEPNAAIFSKDNLTISGSGILEVQGNYQDGIASKDGLVIDGGTIRITATDDGIRGKDYLVIRHAEISIDAGGDGLKSTNADDPERGYICIESGIVEIEAEGDAIHAETDALIREVNMVAVTGGGSGGYITATTSAKGIKGLVYNVIDGGTFNLSCADDAVHSNNVMIINGGLFSIATGDDGFHADSLLVLNDGQIAISTCYEGVESAVIEITGGSVSLVSTDDGINVASGNDGSGMRPGGGGPGWPGQDQFASSGDYYLFMDGGYVAVNTMGDGFDINGAVVMSAGKVLIDGPSANNNGALDYDQSFQMDGGFLLGTGSSGMAQAPGSASGQHSVLVNFNSSIRGGTPVHLARGSGGDLFTFTPTKTYQSVVFSSPDLESGSSYEIYYGGTVTGSVVDGLLTEGTYSPGTSYREFSISGVTTLVR